MAFSLQHFLQAMLDTLQFMFQFMFESTADLRDRIEKLEDKLKDVEVNSDGRIQIYKDVKLFGSNKSLEIEGSFSLDGTANMKDDVDVRGWLTAHNNMTVKQHLYVGGPVEISGIVKAHAFDTWSG